MSTSTYFLRCRECGKTWGNQPRSICEDCFSPLEVTYDYDSIRPRVSRDLFASRAPNIWRYSELLPLPTGYQPSLPVGYTPLVSAPRLGERIGSRKLFVKNDAVCLPTLSFKDRVVAVALAHARSFGFDTVACSSTGNLANSVAAQAARNGFKAWIFIPSDLEPAKISAHSFSARNSSASTAATITSIASARRSLTSIAGDSSTSIFVPTTPKARRQSATKSRATRLETPRQHRRSDGWRIADHQDQEGVR